MKNFSTALLNFLNTNRQYNRADLFAITPGALQNQLAWSQDLEMSVWTNSAVPVPTVTKDAAVDPNGISASADQIVFPVTSSVQESFLQQQAAFVPYNGQVLTFSIWLMAASALTIGLRFVQSTGQNDTTLTVNVGTTWQRFSYTVTMASVGTGPIQVRLEQTASQPAKTIFAWGAQLEMSASMGPYSATQVTPLYGSLGPRPAPIFATSGQLDIVYQGNTYYASKSGAWKRGKITSEASFDLRGNDMELTVFIPASVLYGATFNNTGISLMAAAQLGLLDAALVQVFTAYWPIGGRAEDSIALWGVENKFAGFIKPNGTITRSKIQFEVADGLYLVNQKMPKHVIQAGCRHTLYDPNCTMVPWSFFAASSVASGSTTQSINLAAAVTAPPRFTQGFITFTSGLNIGLSYQIKSQLSTTNILLASAALLPVAIGDTFNMFAGCDKTETTCQNTYNNLSHFGGQPFVPNPEMAI